MMASILIEGLHKSYGKRLALNGLDMTVPEGTIYGFLGPNGAGKTTTIKVILGLIKPDSGKVVVGGREISGEGMQIRRHIGYLPERVSFYRDMSIMDNLSFLCDLKGAPKEDIYDLLDDFRIDESPETKVKELSKGNIQRLGLLQTLIGDPDILVLDEPTSGLDPEIRNWIKERIKSMADEGKTVLLSSHILSEVQELCSMVGLINRGYMVEEAAIDELSERLRLDHTLEIFVDPLERALERVSSLDIVKYPRIEKGKLLLNCDKGDKIRVIEDLIKNGFDIGDFSVKEPALEQVFVRIMEEHK